MGVGRYCCSKFMLFIILLNERMCDVIIRCLWVISVWMHGIHVCAHVQGEDIQTDLVQVDIYILPDLHDFVISIPNCHGMGPWIVRGASRK